MRSIPRILIMLLLPGLVFSSFAKGNPEPQAEAYADQVTTSQLGGTERYLTHVSTDKPVYKTGESVFIRGLVLQAVTNRPYPASYLEAYLEILGPRGDLVTDNYLSANDNILTYQWMIPQSLAGGEYTIRIRYSEYDYGFSPAERKFEIRAYRAPRLKTQVTFFKDGYYPGDEVQAVCEVTRAEGGIPAGAPVNVVARVDNREISTTRGQVDDQGRCYANFRLPAVIEEGDGTLLFIIEDGGVTESAAKTIPILLDNFEVAFYPEGGDLVAGVENRVYFEAGFRNGKPADLSGSITDPAGQAVAAAVTEHEGRGSFSFTPQAGKTYSLKLPASGRIPLVFPLPPVKTGGVVLTAAEPVSGKKQPLVFQLVSPAAGEVRLVISKREAQLTEKRFTLQANLGVAAVMDLPVSADGILRATLWRGDTPLAERLVYRQPQQEVMITLSLDKAEPAPGDTVTLHLKTTTADGRPVGAVAGITVTDEAVLQLLEKREEAPRLPAMVFLENDVQELADANVYLDPQNEQALRQLDLLLATQGWRRFAFVKWNDFLAEYGDKARRVAALTRVEQVSYEEKGGGFFDWLVPKAAPMKMEMAEQPEMAFAEPDFGRIAQAAPDDGPLAGEALPVFEADARLDLNEKWAGDDILAAEAARFIPYVREYAHRRRAGWSPENRSDFTETLYWQAGLATDPVTGKADVTFDLNDSITSFRITADSFTPEGSLGAATLVINSVKPLYIEPKMPLEVTLGDELTIPLALVNNLDQPLSGNIEIRLDNKRVNTIPASLQPRSRSRQFINLRDLPGLGELELVILADFGIYKDNVKRTFKVNAPGFPVEHTAGGIAGPDSPVSFQVEIPGTLIKGSMATFLKVYPSPIANLTQALQALIRQPYGCFEQTSSTSYPLVMAQRYFLSHTDTDPALVKAAKANLDEAYKRLTGFECDKKGYEWFGGDPGHEALTAYGLMQFKEMQEVMPVDQGMIDRTRQWLLNRRDGKGGYQRNPLALDSFGSAPVETTNGYITWALLEAGEQDLAKEIEWVKQKTIATDDSYLIALGANILSKAGQKNEAMQLMDFLQTKQAPGGFIDGAVTSITRSGGQSLIIETTALTLLAWMREDKYAGNVEAAMQYLVAQCQNGMFYSTQGTILALKAIILYAELRAAPAKEGSLQMYVDNKPFGDALNFSRESRGVLELPDFSRLLTAGKHTISVKMTAGSLMPLSAVVSYASRLPVSAGQCRLELATSLAETRIKESSGTEIKISLINRSSEPATTPIAIIGLPGGMEPRHAQLKELVKAGVADAYEIRGQEIIFYWRVLKAAETKNFSVSCLGSLPGKYTAPASRAYEYYTAEYKHWVEGVTATIIPAQ